MITRGRCKVWETPDVWACEIHSLHEAVMGLTTSSTLRIYKIDVPQIVTIEQAAHAFAGLLRGSARGLLEAAAELSP